MLTQTELTVDSTVTAFEGYYEGCQGVIKDIDPETQTALVDWQVSINQWDSYNQEWATETETEMFFPLDNLKVW